MVDVAVAGCGSYDQASKSLKRCLDSIGGLKKYVKKDTKVLLKVNQLVGKEMDKAITTHPSIVDALLSEILKLGAIPAVGDSPAMQSLETVAEKTGIAQVCRKHSVQLVELDNPVDVRIPKGKRVKSMKISGALDKFDLIINMPKLKTHSLTGFTGAVKNLFGCVPGKLKSSYHLKFQKPMDFAEMLLDLYSVVKPRLTIMDAVIGMEGNGPNSGEPRKIGCLIACPDAMAVDRVAIEVIGFSPEEAATIKAARNHRQRSAYIRNIKVKGDKLSDFQIFDFKRPKTSGLNGGFLRTFVAKPVLIPDACIKCGHCRDICPNGAITMTKHGPSFDYKKCIRCYCCHEVCPKKAIDLKHNVLSRTASRILK